MKPGKTEGSAVVPVVRDTTSKEVLLVGGVTVTGCDGKERTQR